VVEKRGRRPEGKKGTDIIVVGVSYIRLKLSPRIPPSVRKKEEGSTGGEKGLTNPAQTGERRSVHCNPIGRAEVERKKREAL